MLGVSRVVLVQFSVKTSLPQQQKQQQEYYIYYISPRSSPKQTAGRMRLLLSITTNQIAACSDKFIFVEQISNGGCKGVI